MHLLLNATYRDRKVGTPIGVIELKRGQYISGRIALASRLEQTERQVRTSLTRLQELEIISIQTTSKFSIYTIENYSIYQDVDVADDQQNDQQATSKRPASDQQATTKQELNNINIKEKNKTSSQANACPVADLVNLYHENMPENPKCKVINKDRTASINARWEESKSLSCLPFGFKTVEEGLAAWASFFRVCNQSAFLTGKVPAVNGKLPFVADIDFLFSPSGFVKCLENKYHRDAA
jgi:hypothetical protein